MRVERLGGLAISALTVVVLTYGTSACGPSTRPTFCKNAQSVETAINEHHAATAQHELNNLINTVAQTNSPDKDTQAIRKDAQKLADSLYDPTVGGGPSSFEIQGIRNRFIKFVDKKCNTSLSGHIPDNGVLG